MTPSKIAVCKLDLSRGGGLTQCHSVLDHGLNLHQNIPLTSIQGIQITTGKSHVSSWLNNTELFKNSQKPTLGLIN